MRSWFRAVEYYEENPVESSEIIAKYYNILAEEYRKKCEGLTWSNYDHQVSLFGNDKMLDTADAISEIKFMNHRISLKPNPEGIINNKKEA